MDYLSNLFIVPDTKVLILLFIIICVISILLAIILGSGAIVMGIVAFIIFAFVIIPSVVSSTYIKDIKIVSNIQTLSVSSLPQQYVNTDTYTFVVDNKEFPTIKNSDTKYFKENLNKPYIIINKITYQAPYVWYVDKNFIKELNNKKTYYLKEVHY